MTFPLTTIDDMVRSQFLLLDHLGIDKVSFLVKNCVAASWRTFEYYLECCSGA